MHAVARLKTIQASAQDIMLVSDRRHVHLGLTMWSSNSAYLGQLFYVYIPNIKFLPKLGLVSQINSQQAFNVRKGF